VIKRAEEIATLMTDAHDAGLYYGLVHLWPLAAVHLEAGHLAEAVAAIRRLQAHTQPPASREGAALEATLTAASRAWDTGQLDLARTSLTAALDLARGLGYL
jgi:predicted negative regulator of RcsB-dependent stress response